MSDLIEPLPHPDPMRWNDSLDRRAALGHLDERDVPGYCTCGELASQCPDQPRRWQGYTRAPDLAAVYEAALPTDAPGAWIRRAIDAHHRLGAPPDGGL